jgi:hypothetical protein
MKSLVEKYSDFVDELKFSRRHILSGSSKEFLSTLKELADKNTFTLKQGDVLYRARRNEYMDHQPSFEPRPSEEMKPVINMKSEGRANPYNITMMYLASSEETAIAEVRPDLNYPVTVGKFKVVNELKLVDFISQRPSWATFYRLPDIGEDVYLWLALSNDYSRPLYKEEQQINYIQTQVIAEYFKDQGFDGLIYQSQFNAQKQASLKSEGIAKNFVIFDTNSVEHVESEVWKITEQVVLVTKLG